MPNKKINELSVRTPSLNDLMIVGDPSTGYSYKATINALTAFVGNNIQFSTLGGISLTNPANGQVLQFNGTNWVNATISVPVTSVFGRTGNVVATEGDYSLTQLGDVTLSTPSTNQVLQYNGTAWVNATLTDNGITSLNGLTAVSQTFATGTSGTDFAISSTTSTHTFNLPTASATNRGALSSADWSTFNAKQNAITLTTTGSSGSATLVGATLNIPTYTLAGLGGVSGSGTTNYLSKWTSSSALGNSLVFDNGTNVGIGTTSPAVKFHIVTNPITSTVTWNAADALLLSSGSPQNFIGIQLQTSSNGGTFIGFASPSQRSLGYIEYSNQNNYLGFGTSPNGTSVGTEKMRLTSAGRLLIGTTTESTYELDVVGDIRSTLDANINGLTVGRGGGNLDGNTIIGSAALTATNTGGGNTALGYEVFQSATSGSSNTAIGVRALRVTTNGYDNTAIGRNSLIALTSGNSVVAIGKDAGLNATTGASNTFIGTGTGAGITTGSFNTIIGAFVTGLSASLSNTIILADGQGNQRLYINNSGNVGIGTTSPTAGYKLDVNGSIYIRNFSTGGLFGGASNSEYIVLATAANSVSGVIQWTNTATYLRGGTSSDLSLGSNNTNDRMIIKSGGNILIGITTDAGYKLDVNGTARVQNTATFSFKSTTLSDVTALFGDNLGVNTGTSRTKVVLGNTSGVSEFIVGQSSTNNLLFNWTYNATAANAYGVLETFAGNNPLVLQSAGAGRVGVGNTSPSYKVDITGDLRATTSAYFATTSGNVGIGTTSPSAKLDIQGDTYGTGHFLLNSTLPSRHTQTSGFKGFWPGANSSLMASTSAGFEGWLLNSNLVRATNGWVCQDVTRPAWHMFALYGTDVFGIERAPATSSVTTLSRLFTIFGSTGNVFVGSSPTDAGYKLDVNGTARVQTSAYFATTSGNVGIGTTSPTAGYKLDVNGSIYIRNFSTGGLFGGASNSEYIVLATAANAVSGVFQWTNTATYLRGGTSSDLSLGSNNTNDRMIIKSGGNVLIGTTTDAGYKLDVNGTANISGATRIFDANLTMQKGAATGDSRISFRYQTLEYGYLSTNTSSGVVSLGSDQGYVLSLSGNRIHTNCRIDVISATATGNGPGYNLRFGTQIYSSYYIDWNAARAIIDTDPAYSLLLRSGTTTGISIATSGNVTIGSSTFLATTSGSVGIGTSSPNASALLDVSSTTKGFLPPRMTNAQMVAIATPAAGLVVYDTTNNKLNVYDGTNWVAVH